MSLNVPVTISTSASKPTIIFSSGWSTIILHSTPAPEFVSDDKPLMPAIEPTESSIDVSEPPVAVGAIEATNPSYVPYAVLTVAVIPSLTL